MLCRLKNFVERHRNEGVEEGALRAQILRADENGLAESGALIKVGRAIWIDEELYFEKFLRRWTVRPKGNHQAE